MSHPISSTFSPDSAQWDRTIGDLTSALGDPTRRAIYIAVREAPDPLTSGDVAKLFSIHPNVARHHLDKLANDGYLQITHRRQSGRSGPGAGRPAKCYEASTKTIDLHLPARRHDLLLDLLHRIIARIAPDDIGAIAEAVGREYGQEVAAQVGDPNESGYDEAVKAIATVMTGIGFEMSPDVEGHRLLTSHCPFGDMATEHPDVVCSLDRGIVTGLFAEVASVCEPVLHPSPMSDEDCITEVPVSIGRR